MGKEEEKAEGEEGENQYQTQSVGKDKKASRDFQWCQQWRTGPPNDRSHWGNHSHVKVLFIMQHIILSLLVKK